MILEHQFGIKMKYLLIILLCGCSVNEYRYNVTHLTEIDPEKAKQIIRDSLNKYPACSKEYNHLVGKYKEIN